MGPEGVTRMQKIKKGLIVKRILFSLFCICIGIICFLCIFIACMIFSESPEKYKNFILNIEQGIVQDYPQVESVNILEFDGWGEAGTLRMQIFFHDNNWLLFGDVHCDKKLDTKKPENIFIDGCNGYGTITYLLTGPSIYERRITISSQCISKEINVPLDNLHDVIENYLAICTYFSNLEDIPDEQFFETGHENWIWEWIGESNVVRFRMPLDESSLRDWVY
jgi:hypothetical protein